MSGTDPAPHFDRLTRALGEKVGKEVSLEDLEADFNKFLEYGVPPQQAVATILRQHGVSPAAASASGAAPRRTGPAKLAEIGPNESFFSTIARVVAVNEKEITVQGAKRKIHYGILGDDTGTRPFTDWAARGLEKGKTYRIAGAYSKEFGGEPQVNFGDRCQIVEGEPGDLPPYQAPTTEATVAALKAGIGNVDVKARVLSVNPKEVTVAGAAKTIYVGTLGDATGKIEYTSWSEPPFEAGQAVRISGAYVKAFRGIPQLNFDDKAKVELLADDAVPAPSDLPAGTKLEVFELVERGGGSDVILEATLLDVRPGSGLVFRCPQCNRVTAKGQCRLHGKVEAKPDLRVKAILDDGTGAVNVVLNQELTVALLGKTLEECRKIASEAMTYEVIEEELRAKLVAHAYRIRGNALSDDFGTMVIAKTVEPLTVDLEAATERAAADLEAVL